MDVSLPDWIQLQRIFFPTATRRCEEIVKSPIKFAHYTSAENCVNLLRKQTLWLRSARVMNDTSEIDYGLYLLQRYMQGHQGLFDESLDSCHAGLARQLGAMFGGLRRLLREHTYFACLSEHASNEINSGRLSMWRAYGGDKSVAIVMNSNAEPISTSMPGVYLLPVNYFGESEFFAELERVRQNIVDNRDQLRTMKSDDVLEMAFRMLRDAVLFTKHPDFIEEREWRVVATAVVPESLTLPFDVETIGGVPQVVVKLKLLGDKVRWRPQARTEPTKLNLRSETTRKIACKGEKLGALVHSIIIGPCQFPEVIRDALRKELLALHVPNASSKIALSNTPLRR